MTVQISMRVAAMRTAIERATGQVAEVMSVDGAVRISAPTPPGDDAAWARLLVVLAGVEKWGAGDATGAHRVWVEISDEGER